jgi:hypothetical protein
MVHQARENGDSMLACCAECLIGCIEALVEVRLRYCSLSLLWLHPLTYASHCFCSVFFRHQYFNKWAFVYVGLYGFSFMESGKNVMALFHSRCVIDFVVPRFLNISENYRSASLFRA